MSVKSRFNLTSDGGLVHRSLSLSMSGFLTGRQWQSSIQNSLRSKLTGYRHSRMTLSKWEGATWFLQLDEVDRIFHGLRKGLEGILESHQTEMDLLLSQQKETKTKSRLAFLYDLEKEIRASERYIRRLEFHISKVEELHELYCIQWKLCQGTVNMKKAFLLSPLSRASKESLLELSRNHTNCQQEMAVMEGQLEILLGQLHIKMKGLIGFARLCIGDQYEVEIKLGCQRWRIRGRIKSDDSQLWDEEDMVFLPHIHQNLEIKVTELRGLGWQLVGMVTCISADFFVAKSQLMLVDITELGTIKLQLEVTWNPFVSAENMRRPSGSRQLVPGKKSSVSSRMTESTSSSTKQYLLQHVAPLSPLQSMARDLQGQEGPLQYLESYNGGNTRGVSLRSYLSRPPHTTSSSNTSSWKYQQIFTFPSSHGQGLETELAPGNIRPLKDSAIKRLKRKVNEKYRVEWENVPDIDSAAAKSETVSLPALQMSNTIDIFRSKAAGKVDPETHQSAVGRDNFTVQELPDVSGAQNKAQEIRLGALIAELEKLLQKQSRSEKELRALDHHILNLATILKNNLSFLTTSSSEETLAVQQVLESFDFLSHDVNTDDDNLCLGSLSLKDSGSSQESIQKSSGPFSNTSLPVFKKELVITPLSSGNWDLDHTLETHLDTCCILLQMMSMTDFSQTKRHLLKEMALQTEVLDRISHLLLEKNNISASDFFPKDQKTKSILLFWEECVSDGSSSFYCHPDIFCRTLKNCYTHKVDAKQPGHIEKVFYRLLQQLQKACQLLPNVKSVRNPDRVTLFQLLVYLKRWNIQELGEHISRISKEEYILSALRSPKRRQVVNKLSRRLIEELLPLECTLQTLAALLINSNYKLCKAAAKCLCRAAGCEGFRSKAVVYYTENLKTPDIQIQQGSCLALKCLRATESVGHIVDMWGSADEDLRCTVKETVLSFDKKSFLAWQQMEQSYNEAEVKTYENKETDITIL